MIRVRSILFMAAVTLTDAALSGCERTQTQQNGYRGLGMVQLDRPANLEAKAAANKVPVALRKANPSGPTAGENFQNVQVLGDLSQAEFARLMLSFKSWIAPEEGCNFCHNAPDYASDAKYPKLVARAMIGMTRHINTNWQSHVKTTGVTCYTCHRGQAVPPKTWFAVPEPVGTGAMVRKPTVLPPTPSAARTVMAIDPLSTFLLEDTPIPVIGPTPLQTGNPHFIKDARATYSMMMIMSDSLGVNCTYCHNSRAFASWELSPPPRLTAWYGIRMARELNASFVVPLAALLPPSRLGPAGDGPKVYCATCHMGLAKPFNGVSLVKNFPELVGPKSAASAPVAGLAAAAEGDSKARN